MKTLCIVLCAVLLSFNAFAKENPFIGTWQLVSGEYINEEGKRIDYKTLAMTSQKVITNQYFSFISLSDGKFWAAGSGSYQFDGNYYQETLSLASFDASRGYKFTYSIDDKLWTNERWFDGKLVEKEVWRRIE